MKTIKEKGEELNKIIEGISEGILLWMGIAFSVISYKYSKYAFLGLALILAYSILNKIHGIKNV